MIETSEQIISLAPALAKAQAEMPVLKKDKVNPHYGSHFVSLDNLIDTTKPILLKHGLVVIQTPAEAGEGRIGLTTTLIHTSGEMIAETMTIETGKSGPQAAGSALTYARRYAWSALLGIATETDDDANAAQGGKPKASSKSNDPFA